MADGASIKLTRADALFAKFRRLRPAADREIAAAILRGAEDVRDLAKRLAPVDSGALRDSIQVEINSDQINPSVRVVAGDKQAYYARWVEFGTAAAEGHRATKARPYMFPSWRLLRKKVRARIGRALGKAARSVAGK